MNGSENDAAKALFTGMLTTLALLAFAAKPSKLRSWMRPAGGALFLSEGTTLRLLIAAMFISGGLGWDSEVWRSGGLDDKTKNFYTKLPIPAPAPVPYYLARHGAGPDTRDNPVYFKKI